VVRQFVDELRSVVREHNLRLPERPLEFVYSGNFCILRDPQAMKTIRITWSVPGAHRICGGNAGSAGEIAWRELDRWKPAGASHIISEASERIMNATEAAQAFLARID
jgi:hypothetical protein